MKEINVSAKARTGFLCGIGVGCLLLLTLSTVVPMSPISHANTDGRMIGPVLAQARDTSAPASSAGSALAKSLEERTAELEKTLEAIRVASEKSEERSYTNKMMGREMIGYVRVVVVILAFIAVAFPLSIWLLSRRRLIGLSGLSSEVTATLLVVEERQAKLASILKEIQSEVDYLHTMSVPDLKNLIQQAEHYLKQNETDLEKAGSNRHSVQSKQ